MVNLFFPKTLSRKVFNSLSLMHVRIRVNPDRRISRIRRTPNPGCRFPALPPVPEDDELDVGIRPGFFDEDQSESEDALEELSRSRSSGSNSRPSPVAGSDHGRNVRPRIAEPEGERGSSLQPSRREPSDTPNAWPNVYDHLNDLPASLQEHFERARQRDREQTEQARDDAHAM